jgi:phage terminase large subunit-like protein
VKLEGEGLQLALEKLNAIRRRECFDPRFHESRPTDQQTQLFADIADILFRYVVAANQTGKSASGAREVSWIFENQHPHWDTQAQFPNTPLLMLVIGRVGAMVEEELWNRKIEPLLTPGCYKKHVLGGVLQKVTHRENGNTIIFMSHHNIREAREKAQGYVAHYVWLDEMPSSVSFLAELETRLIANRGRLLATFTPLLRNREIKDKIEALTAPVGRRYKWAMLDNPIYKGREKELMQQYAGLPEDERNARLFGDWFLGGRNVYSFNAGTDCEDPPNYHQSWPHLLVVDPAGSGKAGVALIAHRPGTESWYVVRTLYLKGAAASDLLDELDKITVGYNIMRRISDPHETWFIKEAIKRRQYYLGVEKKRDRKLELIKNLQEAMNDGKLKITTWVPEVTAELESCMWAEDKDDKIIGASRFHILDCLQYGVDRIPAIKTIPTAIGWEQQMRKDHKKQLAQRVTGERKTTIPGRIVARRGRKLRRC